MTVNPFEENVRAVASETPVPAGDFDLDAASKAVDSASEVSRDDVFMDTVRQNAKPPQEGINVKEWAEQHDVSEEEAQGLLSTYSPEDARIVVDRDRRLRNRPDIKEWGSESPENYQYLQKYYPEILGATEPESTNFSTPVFIQDVGKALQRNMPQIEAAVAIGRYSIGELSNEEFADWLESIRQRQDNQTPYGTDTASFEKALNEFNIEWAKGMSMEDVRNMPREDLEDYVRATVSAMQVAGASAKDMAEMAAIIAWRHKMALGVKSAESLWSVLGPTAGALTGGKLGAIGGPVTATIGGIGGGVAGSYLVRYTQEVHQQLNEYVDENPGATYLEALNDPEVMANIKRVANYYSVTGAALDTAFTRLGGRFATRGYMFRTAVDVGGEGVAEAGATTAKGLAQGKSFEEAASEGVREGFIESLLATPASGTINIIPGATDNFTNKVIS